MADHDVGIIVGRFQVPELHGAHRQLIQHVCDQHDKVVIFLGLTGFSPPVVTRENPLDFEARKQMLLEEFPDLNVLYIKDMNGDEVWSKQLDSKIQDLLTPSQSPMLYGGRDSFISHYQGKYPTTELEPEVYERFSGTEIRKEIARSSTKGNPDFRKGVVWAGFSKFPTCYPTVDVVILNEDETKMLLARKEHEPKLRFIGGFADPSSPNYETDVRREVAEEAHIEITDPTYVGSTIIDDWRYRREVDKIKTLLFEAKFFSGSPKADDDIIELQWVDLDPLAKDWPMKLGPPLYVENTLMPTHIPLLELWVKHRSKVNR